jgi:two-component system OmpR family response regulator
VAQRIMVVDDEQSLRELLKMSLSREGFDVFTYADGPSALAAVAEVEPHAAVVDVMMPDMNGFEVARRLRQDPRIYILMLTARDAVEDRILGLEGGADDYMPKPFSLDELAARLRAGLRRVDPHPPALQHGPIEMDDAAHRVLLHGEPVQLTAKEYELLRYLLLNPDRVLSKVQILTHVWGYDFPGDDNLVEVHVSSLRDKLNDRDKTLIGTVRGFGYRLGG